MKRKRNSRSGYARSKSTRPEPLSETTIAKLLRYQDRLRHGDRVVVDDQVVIVEDTCDEPSCAGSCLERSNRVIYLGDNDRLAS